MALKIVLLALLVYCAVTCNCQAQDSLPLTYEVVEIQGDGATCPNDQLRNETLQQILDETRTQIITSIVPLLRPSTQCPCLANGGRRIAYLDMTDPNQQCPPAWNLITSPRRTCGRRTDAGCDSAFFPSNGNYSRVCGRVIAYQCGDTDAFWVYGFQPSRTIDDVYSDVVSVTHGSGPRQHVWTFTAAVYETSTSTSVCPCTNTNNSNIGNIRIPPFVGDDYFCDTGAKTVASTSTCNNYQNLFHDDPLWDGAGCGPTSTCCEFNNPPWFCKILPQPTTDDIEVRICASDLIQAEDIPVEIIEIYVS